MPFASFIIPLHTHKKESPLKHIRFFTTYRLLTALTLILFSSTSMAQSGGTFSSYSRFGLGLVNDNSQTWNRSMGGVGMALPSGNKLNTMNPASYAYLDSLSFIMDAGMSGNFGHMTLNNSSKNVNNASFDYVVMGFRLRKNLGIGFGFRPFSTINYAYTTTGKEAIRDEITGELIRNNTDYSGSGGLNQAFVGLGWSPVSNFSIGANVSILWGHATHIMTQNFTADGSSTSNFNGFNFVQYADLLTYKLDFGAQYAIRLSHADWLTIGAGVGLGHKFDGDAKLYRFMSSGDTLTVNGDKNGFDIPMTYAGGVTWQHQNRLTVSADAHYQTWGNCRMPMMVITDNNVSYPSTNSIYNNVFMIKAGAEYTPNPMASKYYNRIKYRLGFSYTSPQLNIPTTDGQTTLMQKGPRELCLSLGFGLPITNRINSRSMVNLGVQWLNRRSQAAGLMTENYLVLNLGVTFNERWFMKFKIQ